MTESDEEAIMTQGSSSEDEEADSMDIYVGNLSYATTDRQLQQAFEQFGKVTSARVVTDRETGRSKGFGFVQMPDRGEATKAIEGMNGSELDGRSLRVNESQPRPRSGGSNRGGRW